MIPLPHFKAATVGVLGLGPSGRAVVRALNEAGAKVIAWDGDETVMNSVDAHCAPINAWPYDRISTIILADGRRAGRAQKLVERARSEDIPVLTDLDLFTDTLARLSPDERPRVVAVTGGAGKSVTASIISHILSDLGRPTALGGQVGQPFMALPAPTREMTYVLELPVRRLATAKSFHCNIAVIPNVAGSSAPDEIELSLKSLSRIFKPQSKSDAVVIGVDDKLGQRLCMLLRSGQVPSAQMGAVIPVSGEASLGHGVFAIDGIASSVSRGRTAVLGDFTRAPSFAGAHFYQDAAAAIATCLQLGVTPSLIIKALHSYGGLRGRFECIGMAGPVLFVDDSYASTVAAAQRAINACPDVFWIGARRLPAKTPIVRSSLSTVHGQYLFGALSRSVEEPTFDTLSAALAAATADAAQLAAADSTAAPVVLFAPGARPEQSGFQYQEFRHAAEPLMADEALYA